MFFQSKQCFGNHLHAEIYPTTVAVSDLERSRGPTFLGTPHHKILTKIPTPILAFPKAGQASMPPYGQIRSRTSGFMWSELCETPHLSFFSVFQEVQVRPIILPYAFVCSR